jgi:concanavalin A-like lectin/glucanase superfamily protein
LRCVYRLCWLLLLPAACTTPPPDQGLVGWWKFDERQGQTAADSSGHGNSATILNGDWGEGVDSGALLLDGSGDSLITVPLSDSLRATGKAITVSALAFRTAEHNVALIAHGYPVFFFGFHGPQFKFEIALDNGRGAACYADDAKFHADLNRWYHVAATFNGWVARLYVDGQEICNDWTYGSIKMPNVPFTIGSYLDDHGKIIDEMTGLIADVRIYDRALSVGEIKALAATSHPRQSSLQISRTE